MINIRTDRGAEFARAEAMARNSGRNVHISGVYYVRDQPTMRDYVFATTVVR